MNKQTKILLAVMSIISTLAVVGTFFYYQRLNSFEDPRIIGAKKIFLKYDNAKKDLDFKELLEFMDQIEAIYQNTPGYKDSFELGVVYNNRGAIYLAEALKEKNELLFNQAKTHTFKSIKLYENWILRFNLKSSKKIKKEIKLFFNENEPIFKKVNLDKVIELWPENHIAKNNLRILLGKKAIKRSVIDKMFPPEKGKR